MLNLCCKEKSVTNVNYQVNRSKNDSWKIPKVSHACCRRFSFFLTEFLQRWHMHQTKVGSVPGNMTGLTSPNAHIYCFTSVLYLQSSFYCFSCFGKVSSPLISMSLMTTRSKLIFWANRKAWFSWNMYGMQVGEPETGPKMINPFVRGRAIRKYHSSSNQYSARGFFIDWQSRNKIF